jgi:hypothetical protein
MILGVDPGISGAVAFLAPDGALVVEDVPVADAQVEPCELSRLIRRHAPRLAIVEAVAAFPGQGVSSVFKFGRAYGTVLGVLGALQIPYTLVSSTRWKKHFRLSADKEEARALAIRTWPGSEAFKRKKDHGRAEAALLAKYAAETLPEARA